jgi:hypothetical protein
MKKKFQLATHKKGHQLHIFHNVALHFDNHINADSRRNKKQLFRPDFTPSSRHKLFSASLFRVRCNSKSENLHVTHFSKQRQLKKGDRRALGDGGEEENL